MVTRVPTRMITTTGVQVGSYTAADITVNEAGQITSAASNSIVASGGGGPKITGVVVTDNAWTVLDDTAVDVLGGYIKITGTGFTSGCLVYFNQTPANSVSFVSSTELRVTTGALSAGTYVVYAINTDGGVAIRVPGVTFSASPAWQTASTLSDQYDGVAITLGLIASEATSYTLVSGSLPPGLSLNSSTGAITGTVVGVTVDTSYTFTVRATDAQNQDSPRTFTVTITVSDLHFNRTTLLLSGSAISANTVLRDSSTNNFNLTAFGDTRASNFTPYGTGWSVYFDGTGDYLSSTINTIPNSSTPFTVEAWIYPTAFSGTSTIFGGVTNIAEIQFSSGGISYNKAGVAAILSSATTLTLNAWNHIAVVRNGSNNSSILLNGVRLTTTTSDSNTFSATTSYIGSGGATQYCFGYLSNLRFVVGTAVYDPTQTTYSIPTSPLTAITNTSLLTCHTNRFLDGSTNNFAITRNGDARVVSFNPFNITNTGVDGSMYFDGTGDYITAPFHASEYNFGTGNFTIQTWFYIDTDKTITGASGGMIFSYQFENFQLYYVNSPSYLYCDIRNWGTNISLQSTTQIRQGQWYHVAIIRDGISSVKMYLNGVLEATSTTNPGNINFNTYNIYTGVRYNPTGGALDYYHKGYISNLRITNTAISVVNLLDATTAVTGTKLLTLQYKQPHNNHTFLDASSNQFLITRSGNATQGSFSPFSPSGWSMFVGGAGYQRWDTNTNYSGTDLTIECWAYATATTTTYTSLISSNLGTGNYYAYFDLGIDGSNLLSCSFYGTSQVVCKNTTSFPLNTWVHCAVVLTSAGAVSLYQAGQRVATASSATIASISTGIQVGGLVQTSGGGYTAYFNGYISNARIVKSAVYSGTTITVPTTALSAIANTNLLVCGENRAVDKANGYTLGVNTVSRTAVAFSPFAPTAVYNPVIHGGSLYLDGNDSLTFSKEAVNNLSTNNFTWECWVYRTAVNDTTYADAICCSVTNYTGLAVGIDPAGKVGYTIGNTAAGNNWNIRLGVDPSTPKGSITVPLNSWTHVALVRNGTQFVGFVNGAVDQSFTSSDAVGNIASDYYIGRWHDAYNRFWIGYISNIRLIKGINLYSTTTTTNGTQIFSPPTSPFTSTKETSYLFNFTDAAILDSTGRNAVETVADAKSSSVVTKFTGASMYFDGTGDYLTIADSPVLELGTGDFTIEAWIYPTLITGSNRGIFGHGTDGNNWWGFFLQPTGVLEFGAASGGSVFVSRISSNTISLNTWTHVAVTRNGSTFKLWIGGSEPPSYTGSPATTSSAITDWSSPFWVGGPRWSGSNTEFVGYIQDLRITRGHARYTSNFTPPTGPHRLK